MTKTNTNETTRVTKRERIDTILGFEEVKTNPEIVDFLNKELELLDRKNNGKREPTPKQVENAEIKSKILEILAENPNTIYTATEIMKAVAPTFPHIEFSNQKISQLLRLMGENGSKEVLRTTVKGRSYFQINK